MKHLLALITAGLALTSFASAATYSFQLLNNVTINGKELKAGDYQVEVKDTTAVIRKGKDKTEVKVKMETTDHKYDSTAVRYSVEGGKNSLEEIHVGGTKTKIVFEEPKTANGGE